MVEKPKYPKKYRKVTPEINEKIHLLYKNGMKQIEIARYFNLSPPTITKRLHEKSRLISLASSKKLNRIYRKDPNYVAKINEAVRKSVNRRYHNDKSYRKFLKDYSYFDKRNRRDEISEYNKRWYLENKLKLIKRNNLTEREGYKANRTKTRKNGENR